MELIIRNNSGQPIYDQISGQIKAQILSGALSPGDALPSIRGLAKDLKISVITTKRAYDELEAQGLINTVAGKGCLWRSRIWLCSGSNRSTCSRTIWPPPQSWRGPAAFQSRNWRSCCATSGRDLYDKRH